MDIASFPLGAIASVRSHLAKGIYVISGQAIHVCEELCSAPSMQLSLSICMPIRIQFKQVKNEVLPTLGTLINYAGYQTYLRYCRWGCRNDFFLSLKIIKYFCYN